MTAVDRLRRAAMALTGLTLAVAAIACRPTYAAHGPRAALMAGEPVRAGGGRIVEGPEQITAFAPEDTSVHVDAATVNLMQVFEDLGENATMWYQHVQTLANPFFEGRAPETRGQQLTADYVEFWFKHYQLGPAFPLDAGQGGEGDWVTYRQPFEYTRRGPTHVRVESAAMRIGAGDALQETDDYAVLGVSASGEVTGPVSFVGYGIAEGPDGYTSFDDDTDLTGRVALLLRYTPMDDEGEALWDEDAERREGALGRKFKALTDRGAAAVILVNPPGAADAPKRLERIDRSSRFGPELAVPVVQVTPDTARAILAAADPDGGTLDAWRRLADRGAVRTIDLAAAATVTIQTEVERRRDESVLSGQNVGGVLSGHGALADQWIVIGGHHDHVGLGRHGGVMPGNRGQMHPGADDNASGAAGVLVLAKMLSEDYADARGDRRSIMFLTFDAEEMGLQGSRAFTEHAPIRPEQISLMLNMDMIGRLRGGNLSVLGTATAEGLEEFLEPHFLSSGLTVSVTAAGSGRSDDANFHAIGVPALHFFTGMHPQYTTPADQAYTVNPAGAALVLGLMADIALDAATMPQRLKYQKPPERRPGQDRGYAGVRLGIQPDMGGDVEGVRIAAISEGTSADVAGMRAGDVIVAWGGQPVRGMEDLFEHLQQHEPGDRVKVTVVRDGRRIELGVTLKASGR